MHCHWFIYSTGGWDHTFSYKEQHFEGGGGGVLLCSRKNPFVVVSEYATEAATVLLQNYRMDAGLWLHPEFDRIFFFFFPSTHD